MKVLSVNAGSSSLKFSLYEMPEGDMLINGYIQKIGELGSFYYIKLNGEKHTFEKDITNFHDAIRVVFDSLKEFNIISDINEIEAVGHRVVHGGERYSESVLIDEDVINEIDKLSALAPLHNPSNLLGIKAFMEDLPNAKQVAVFDTAFHQTIDKEEYMYAIPYEWYSEYGVRKYGFHGTSHRYIYKKTKEIEGRDLKVISCHLGNGASLCAINNGISVDTSMGFTPLPGLVMGTRCGDIDPAIIDYIMKKENKSIDEVMEDLNKRSGLLGLSGISNDFRELNENGDNERVILAKDVFARRVVNYISAYYTLLGGVDAIVFTAGVGENQDDVREEILNRLSVFGLVYDKEKNKNNEKLLTSDESKVRVYVMSTDEEIMIAEDTYNLSK